MAQDPAQRGDAVNRRTAARTRARGTAPRLSEVDLQQKAAVIESRLHMAVRVAVVGLQDPEDLRTSGTTGLATSRASARRGRRIDDALATLLRATRLRRLRCGR